MSYLWWYAEEVKYVKNLNWNTSCLSFNIFFFGLLRSRLLSLRISFHHPWWITKQNSKYNGKIAKVGKMKDSKPLQTWPQTGSAAQEENNSGCPAETEVNVSSKHIWTVKLNRADRQYCTDGCTCCECLIKKKYKFVLVFMSVPTLIKQLKRENELR